MKKRYAMQILGMAFLLFSSTALQAQASDQVEQTFQVAAGGTLRLDADMGSLEVTSGDSNLVDVLVIEKVNSNDPADLQDELGRLRLDIHQEGSDVVVMAKYENRGSWHGNHLNLHFQIQVPYRYNIEATTAGGSISLDDLEGDVRVRTAGGSLRFGRILGNVQGRTAGGSVSLEGSSGMVDVETAGGSITIGEVEADVVAHTSGGSISVQEVYGSIDATTSGGSISVSIASQPAADCRLTTSGGSVSVSLARGIGLDLDAETGNGRVMSDFGHVDTSSRESERRLQTQISGGGPQLFLRTSGGNIQIREMP